MAHFPQLIPLGLYVFAGWGLYSFLGGTAFGPLCLVLLGIRSPGASALVTEDLQHDIGETRIPGSFLGDGHSAW